MGPLVAYLRLFDNKRLHIPEQLLRKTFERIKELVRFGDVKISEHGYDELVDDGLTVGEIIESMEGSVVIEDYPNSPKGASILVFHKDKYENSVHVVWGIPKGTLINYKS